jgi:2-iminoacetate synthase
LDIRLLDFSAGFATLMPVSFVAEFNALPIEDLLDRARTASPRAVQAILDQSDLRVQDFACLLSPSAGATLEALARRAHLVTRRRFGRVIRLFAPLYLSNECINNCQYCGFSRDNPIRRVTLTIEEVIHEARALQAQGFRNILLVAGEHPKFVSSSYLQHCVTALHAEVPSLSLEVGPLSEEEYRPLVTAGADGLVVYQETYDRATYAALHTAGPKRDFDWRLATPERAYAAGFRRIGIGALHGLADWRFESIALAAHAAWLLRHCWKAFFTVSVPRLRPCAGEFQPPTRLGDRDMVQLICALRLFLPDVGLVLSTREPAPLRDGLLPLGITLISAGSHTEPGGYTGAGRENTHLTQRGHILATPPTGSNPTSSFPVRSVAATDATQQFEIADPRSAAEVADRIRGLGYEPVWKDWDHALAPV